MKGKSGNPKGRPKKKLPTVTEARTSVFDIITDLTLPVSQDGSVREVALQEALALKTYQAALEGSMLARKKIIKMIEDREKIRAKLQKPHYPEARFAAIQIVSVDPRNADAAMIILDIVRHNAEPAEYADEGLQLLLEPWAVKAAFSRRRSTIELSENECWEIERCTRDFASLNLWPVQRK
jgi:hypothetical protein